MCALSKQLSQIAFYVCDLQHVIEAEQKDRVNADKLKLRSESEWCEGVEEGGSGCLEGNGVNEKESVEGTRRE